MTEKEKDEVEKLVEIICGTTTMPEDHAKELTAQNIDVTPDCPTEATIKAAEKLLRIAGVSESAEIFEIPLCWDNQVCIRFTLGNSDIIFDLSAGINCNDNSEFFIFLQVENNEPEIFPVCSDDDVGIFLFKLSWKYNQKKDSGKNIKIC